jgi:hypothetical protein
MVTIDIPTQVIKQKIKVRANLFDANHQIKKKAFYYGGRSAFQPAEHFY